MTYRLRNIAVAVGLALVAALLTTFYVANYKRHVQQSETTVKVFVAKRDIPQGTPGTELVAKGWIGSADVVQRNVVPGAITNPQQVAALTTSQSVFAGEQVTLRRFANHAELGIRSQLSGTMRALSIAGSGEQLLAGTLRDGDHVDVIANLKTGSCPTCFAVRMVARDLLVLRAPTGDTSNVTTGTGTVSTILAVSDRKEAQKVYFAVGNAAGWSLGLRAVSKAVDSHEDIEHIESMLKDSSPTNLLTVPR
jgi:Flp pilus assembly protein CpaB